MALTPNYGGFGFVGGVNYIQCVRCQVCHFEDEALYKQHIGFQSKHGVFQMSRQDFDRMRRGQALAREANGTVRLAGDPRDGARAVFVKAYPASGGVKVRLAEKRGRFEAGDEVILRAEEFEADPESSAGVEAVT